MVKIVAHIDGDLCIQCGICVSECPHSAIAFNADTCMVEAVSAAACAFPSCGSLCRAACPVWAIDFLPEETGGGVVDNEDIMVEKPIDGGPGEWA